MKLISIFLLIVFASFLVTPAIVHLSGEKVDISFFFSMNEEENSNKNHQAVYEFNLEKIQSNFESIRFLKKQKPFNEFYLHNYGNVFIDVLSPPPRFS